MRERGVVILAVLIVAGLFAVLFRDRLTAMTGGQLASLIYGLMALVLVAGGYYSRASTGLGPSWLRDALMWFCIILGLALAFPLIAPYLPARFND